MATYTSIPAFTSGQVLTSAVMNDVKNNLDLVNAQSVYPFRNLIQNGGMTVCQRATSISYGTGGGTAYYASDRFHLRDYTWSAGSNITLSQDAGVFPTGFRNSLKVATGATGLTFASGGVLGISHKIEGYNIAHAYNSTLSLTFWVRSSVTGTYSVSFTNKDVDIVTVDRIYVASYTINAANTWEQKTITVDMSAATTSGTWNTTTGIGLHIEWGLGSHSDRRTDVYNSAWSNWSGSSIGWQRTTQTQWASTANATFYLTGVQLEVGSVSTPFEFLPYGDELARCQRYFWRWGGGGNGYDPLGAAAVSGTTSARLHINLPVPMRARPTGLTTNGTSLVIFMGAGGGNCTIAIDRSNTTSVLAAVTGTGLTNLAAAIVTGAADGTTTVDFTGAEL